MVVIGVSIVAIKQTLLSMHEPSDLQKKYYHKICGEVGHLDWGKEKVTMLPKRRSSRVGVEGGLEGKIRSIARMASNRVSLLADQGRNRWTGGDIGLREVLVVASFPIGDPKLDGFLELGCNIGLAGATEGVKRIVKGCTLKMSASLGTLIVNRVATKASQMIAGSCIQGLWQI